MLRHPQPLHSCVPVPLADGQDCQQTVRVPWDGRKEQWAYCVAELLGSDRRKFNIAQKQFTEMKTGCLQCCLSCAVQLSGRPTSLGNAEVVRQGVQRYSEIKQVNPPLPVLKQQPSHPWRAEHFCDELPGSSQQPQPSWPGKRCSPSHSPDPHQQPKLKAGSTSQGGKPGCSLRVR